MDEHCELLIESTSLGRKKGAAERKREIATRLNDINEDAAALQIFLARASIVWQPTVGAQQPQLQLQQQRQQQQQQQQQARPHSSVKTGGAVVRSFHCTPPAPPISSTSAWRCVRKTAKFKATKTNAARAKIRPRRLSRRLQARTAKTRASQDRAANSARRRLPRRPQSKRPRRRPRVARERPRRWPRRGVELGRMGNSCIWDYLFFVFVPRCYALCCLHCLTHMGGAGWAGSVL